MKIKKFSDLVTTVKKFNPLTWLVLILAFTFVTRIYKLEKPNRYVFDEVYHAVTAKLISRGDQSAYEWWHPAPEENTAIDWLHPPLAKYTQALSIKVFGENSFGWRFSSVVFGTGVVWMTYLLARELFKDERLSLIAAFLVSLDGLVFTQSRIAMNDIHVTFFILVTLFFYSRYLKTRSPSPKKLATTSRGLLLTGVAAGLAMGSKWSGFFVLATVGGWEGLFIIHGLLTAKSAEARKTWLKHIGKTFVAFVLIPIFMYLAAYGHMFIQGKSLFCFEQQQIEGVCYFERLPWMGGEWEGYISHFAALHRQIWWYQTTLEATHGYQSRPWQWFLNLRPVWYHVKYAANGEGTIANIYALGNTAIFWLGDISVFMTLAALPMAFALKNLPVATAKKKKSLSLSAKAAYFLGEIPTELLFLFIAYLMVWFPWVMSPRIMFFYHYTPAVPLLCIILAYWTTALGKRGFDKNFSIQWAVVIAALIFFVVWYPNWTGISVDADFANAVYFGIKSWK